MTLTTGKGLAAVTVLCALTMSRAGALEPQPRQGTSIVAAGQAFAVGRPVVLWRDPPGFDA